MWSVPGSAASCSDAALNAALAGGWLVTFNCDSAPATVCGGDCNVNGNVDELVTGVNIALGSATL